MSWKAFLEKKDWSGVTNLRIAKMSPDSIDVVQPIAFKRYNRSDAIPDDEIALQGAIWDDGEVRMFLQAIVDLAWNEGIKPAGLADHTSELKATRYHLEDMRTLALTSPHAKGEA